MKYDSTLVIEKNYETFDQFYDDNKLTIYNDIIKIFELLTKKKKKKVSLLVESKIKDIEFKTVFEYDKEKKDLLKEFFVPYFEKNEQYEKCDEIMDIYNKL